MSDSVRMPPRPPPPGTPVRTQQRSPADGAKQTAQAKKKMQDPLANANLGADSFSRAITGSSTVRSRMNQGAAATVRFLPQGEPSQEGELRQGGQLFIHYDPARARLKEAPGGIPAWGVTGFVRFLPGGEGHERLVVEFSGGGGAHPTFQARSAPFTVPIPVAATEAHVWFKNWVRIKGRGLQEELDNQGGQDFVFPVQPASQMRRE